DQAMFDALIEAGEHLCQVSDLRAVVLSGQGKAFCAGLDMGRFEGMASAQGQSHELRLMPRVYGHANAPQHAVLVWRKIPVPVIAAVHGVALGGGFQLMLGADMRFVEPQTKLSIMEIKWGLVPDMGGVALMRRLMRSDQIRELTYSGRIFSGQEAFELGLATRLCDDPRSEALAMAHEIALRSPDAIRAAKRLYALADDGASEAALLLAESREQAALLGAANQVESVRANLEKRSPVWR
ncbi:MAG: crotonase/enoyl-CoA hydratase family protein, partial [Betaproteobacteria bacterium]|nr:crotonase/enoyl-CoA hydratase family protein [Betaproteobacteria bacterium]